MNQPKRYDLEDPSSPTWARHRKHIFVLSSAGKPIFSRFGDESKIAPLVGVLQALISFVGDSDDTIRSIHAGAHRAVFLMRGPLYLVAVSCGGDTVPYLMRQLGAVHSQIISILTSKIETIFTRNAAYDLRSLLGGTDRVLRGLIRNCSRESAHLLQAVPMVKLSPAARSELGKLLACCRTPSVLFGMVLSRGCLAHLLRPKRQHLRPSDILLVMNAVASSLSFRDDESWLPICLPDFNERAFLYAHISFVSPALSLVLLSPSGDAFPELSANRLQFADGLRASSLARLAFASTSASPQSSLADVSAPEVTHFLYRSCSLDQYTASRPGHDGDLASPYREHAAHKLLLQRYQLAHSRVHAESKPLREYYQASDTEVVVVLNASDFELFVAFGPLVTKARALASCQVLLRWLKREHESLFLTYPVIK